MDATQAFESRSIKLYGENRNARLLFGAQNTLKHFRKYLDYVNIFFNKKGKIYLITLLLYLAHFSIKRKRTTMKHFHREAFT